MIDATKLPSTFGARTVIAQSSPTNEPVTLQQAKDQLRVNLDDEDAYIESLIVASRHMAENLTNRTITQRQRTVTFAGWGDDMRLFKPPFVSIDSVSYLDEEGQPQELDALRYYVDKNNDISRIVLLSGEPFPALYRGARPITVTYTAGYPEDEVPPTIVQWMLMTIGTMYDNRETIINGVSSAPLADNFIWWLLQPHRVYE